MRLRPYKKGDAKVICTWISGEESHFMWCANTLPYAFTEEEFQKRVDEYEDMGESAFTATDEDGNPIGFFFLKIQKQEKKGFMRYIIVDPSVRGQGYGRQMVRLAAEYAFHIAGLSSIGLNVFDDNPAAAACYKGIGFTFQDDKLPLLDFQGRIWGRTRMELQR